MRPTWGTVGVAAALGCALGAVAVEAMRPAREQTLPPHGTGGGRSPGATQEGLDSPPTKDEPGVAAAPSPRETGDPASEQAARVRRRIRDLEDARSSRDREAFDRALHDLLGENDAAAHAFLRDLVADPDFEFPDGHHAVWFGASDGLRLSPVPGWAAAARARYQRDGRRPGLSWDAGAWLYLVAAHGDEEDLAWVAAQYEVAPERQGEAIAALGAARPALAREALLREIRREPLRDGVWDAIVGLAERAPAEAFAVLHAMVTADSPHFPNSRAEVLRAWARTAPEDALDEVRTGIHALAGAGQDVRALITPVQVLADRGQDVSEFSGLIGTAGRELRRLVDEQGRADGTGPYYAIEYHRVAQTVENLGALEYAVQVLGPERTVGCRAILENARTRSEWK